MKIFLIILLNFNLISSVQFCDNKYCNSHGLCTLNGGQKECECVENVYYGDKCEKSIKFCDKNYCENIKSCRDFTGGYLCECEAGYGSQNCSKRSSRVFVNPLVIVNSVVLVNSEQYFIVFLEKLPEIEIVLDVSTYNYMIESFLFSSSDRGYFQETSNLRTIAIRYGIIDYGVIDLLRGYYVALKYSLTKLIRYRMLLTFTNYQSDDELYYWEFGVLVFEPALKCIPDVENYDCANPKVPMSIAIDRQYTIAPIIKRNCGSNSKLSFDWSVTNYFDNEVMHVFQHYTRRQLNLLPYVMEFDDKFNKYRTFYVIKLRVDEATPDGSRTVGTSYLRCYVRIIMKPPAAEIKGGTKRQLAGITKIVLDATQSQDLSHAATKAVSPTLKFSWACESVDDPTNRYCTQLASTQSIISVPSNKLIVSKTYKFTITVKSKTTEKSSSKSQIITVTESQEIPLELNVICLKNCRSPVSANAELFLKGECVSCTDQSNAVQYKWELENKIIGDRKRLIIPADYLGKDVYYEIRLHVELNGAKGEYFYGFKTNQGIGDGKCKIDPEKDGLALKTIYNITCYNFDSPYEPLEYKVYANHRIVASSYNSEFGFRVRNNENQLVIKVFDPYGEFSTFNLDINNKPVQFQSFDEYNWLAWDNDVQGIAVMIECEIDALGNSVNKDKAIVFMMNMLKNVEFSPTTFDMELGTNTLVKLLNEFELDYEKALILLDVLDNYLTVLREFSYIDAILLTRDFIEILNVNYINIMDNLYTEIVIIPAENYEIYANDANELKLYEDEDYPEYPDLDFEAVRKIMQLERIIYKTEQLYSSLNRIISKRLEVSETAVFYENVMNYMKSFTVSNDVADVEESLKIMVPNFEIEVSLEIFKLADEITINLKYFQSLLDTPFWWLPQSEKQFTTIFMLQLTKHSNGNNVPISIRPILNYHISIGKSQRRRVPPRIPLPKAVKVNKIENIIYNNSDIAIYTFSYNKNELILINFETKGGPNLQLVFKPDSVPNYNDFRDTVPMFMTEGMNRLIRLQYQQNLEIFMGVILEDDDDPSTNIEFSFTIETLACSYFNFAIRKWTTNNCRTAFNSTKTDIWCSCTNQNTNLYSVFNKPKRIIFYNRYDRMFVRHLPIDFTIVIIILVLLLIFICLLLIILLKTKRNNSNGHISDNIIGTNNPAYHNYLLTIICGTSRIRNRVTTSNIGIQMYGDRNSSDQYILNLRTANTNTENIYQFVLKSKNDLGDLDKILLWIDYNGSSPSFDCDEIIITSYDRTYRFFIYDRLSLQYQNTNIIKMININDKNKLTFLKLLQRNYFKHNLLINSYRNVIYLALLFLRITLIILILVLLMGRTTFENYKYYTSIEINYLNISICIVIVVVVEKLIYYLYLKYFRR